MALQAFNRLRQDSDAVETGAVHSGLHFDVDACLPLQLVRMLERLLPIAADRGHRTPRRCSMAQAKAIPFHHAHDEEIRALATGAPPASYASSALYTPK